MEEEKEMNKQQLIKLEANFNAAQKTNQELEVGNNFDVVIIL